MGESIAEGTIVRWIKKVGDSVDRDEPLFEISTDKVDAEIPSPAAGVLTAIAVKEGETVAVNSVVATIGVPGEASEPRDASDAGPERQPAPNGSKSSAQADGTSAPTLEAPPPPSTTTASPASPASPASLASPASPPHPRHPRKAIATSPRRSSARSRRSTTSTSAKSRDLASAAALPSRTFLASSIAEPHPCRPRHARLRSRRRYL